MTTIRPLTKVICTLGPASWAEEQIEALARAGMTVARINLSHGNWEQHQKTIHAVRNVSEKLRKANEYPFCIATLLDTKGAEVRTGDVKEPLHIRKGEDVVFSAKPHTEKTMQVIHVDHAGFGDDAKQAEQILIDNGKIRFDLQEVRPDGTVVARAREDGMIGSRRHVNLPGADLALPSLSKEDWEEVIQGADEGVDFFALSFIRRASEVEEVRDALKKRKKSVGLIAKIETRQSVANMQAIIDASDSIMVARGDLGVEVSFETIPVIQDQLVSSCREAGKAVIVATHMLESMIESPMPTRAEVTDIAHAATTGADSTMLSGETAGGKYPVASLEAMTRVLSATESHMAKAAKMEQASVRSERDARAEAAVKLAVSTGASAIVAITKSGQTARDLSRFRPKIPIIAFTTSPEAQRSLQLCYGVIPYVIPFDEHDPEVTVKAAFEIAKKSDMLHPNDKCVLISDTMAGTVRVGSLEIRTILIA